MTALSIRRMNETMVWKEQMVDVFYQTMKPTERVIHYWHVERKAKRGKKWIFVSRFYVTKAEMAELFCKYYRNDERSYRLVHMMRY